MYLSSICMNLSSMKYIEMRKHQNNDFKRCQDFEDMGKIRCPCQNGSRHKNWDKIVTLPIKFWANLIQFLCRLPFWQRHLIFPMSSKSWHLLKSLFWCFLISIYFIELKFINVENSVYIYLSLFLSLYVSYHSKVKLFVKVFYWFLIDHSEQSIRATEILKVVLESS